MSSRLSPVHLLPLLALPLLAWLLPAATEPPLDAEQVNLALRHTAHALLRQSGDSTSRIPAIEQDGRIWRVHLEQPFSYDALPALLQAALERYAIKTTYRVTLRRCEDASILLGYQQLDVFQPEGVPCGGRVMPEGCHYIEVAFAEAEATPPLWYRLRIAVAVLLAGALALWLWSMRARPLPPAPETGHWIAFGNSRLDADGLMLISGDTRQSLTFREAKLLRLFATHPDQLLDRDTILKQVWADEGVLVGRSVDMFVSRLRKKLAPDASLSIVAVHGVGYRLETKRG